MRSIITGIAVLAFAATSCIEVPDLAATEKLSASKENQKLILRTLEAEDSTRPLDQSRQNSKETVQPSAKPSIALPQTTTEVRVPQIPATMKQARPAQKTEPALKLNLIPIKESKPAVTARKEAAAEKPIPIVKPIIQDPKPIQLSKSEVEKLHLDAAEKAKVRQFDQAYHAAGRSVHLEKPVVGPITPKTRNPIKEDLPGFASSSSYIQEPYSAQMAPAITGDAMPLLPSENSKSREDQQHRERISQYVKETETMTGDQENSRSSTNAMKTNSVQIPINAPINGLFSESAPKEQNVKMIPVSLPSSAKQTKPQPKAAVETSQAAAVPPMPAGSSAPTMSETSYRMDQTVCQRRSLRDRFYYDWWLAGGVTSNAQPPITTSSVSGDPSYPGNVDATNLEMNQFYAVLGIETEKENRVSFGARADLLYGTDYLLAGSVGLETQNYRRTTAGGGPAQSVYEATPRWNMTEEGGFPRYGLAMPQLYGEAYLPILEGLSIKMGHYYSPTGVESVMSPQNFFYSNSYSMLFGTPQTLTGVLATQKLNDNLSILVGCDQGWNTWDSKTGYVSMLGGFVWENNDKDASVAFTLMNGDRAVQIDGTSKDPIIKGNMTNYSLVFRKQLNCCWRFMLEHDLGCFENGAQYLNEDRQLTFENANWYTIAGYLIYDYSECLSFGMRMEWFQDSGYSRWLSNPSLIRTTSYNTQGQDYYDLTFGANWKPTNSLLIRPEIRYDWSNYERIYNRTGKSYYAYDQGNKKDLFTLGCDMILQF